MKNIYKNNPMNEPRLGTDKLFANYENEYEYTGFMNEAFSFVEKKQLLSAELWKRFVSQFKKADADSDGGWRGEYWGKMMRGACFVYSYTKNPHLYEILTETVTDMMGAARVGEGGRISSYARSHEFCHWDLWARKYVLLGMQYFYEICVDASLRERLVSSMKTQLDCIMAGIGPEEGKKRITHAAHHWRGLNSSSLLEPVVRLYSLTGEKKYFDFASYIVSEGGTDVVNIFELACKNDFPLHQYPVTKAYEMTSCFEGLLEYYRITGEEKFKTALINYADRILTEDFTVIGSAGCTHELFDHSTVRQANPIGDDARMQETCVTVTLMKFFYQMHLLTGDAKYADAFEISLYNAYLGAFNTEDKIEPSIAARAGELVIEPLPFDSYSPLTSGTRGVRIGGLKPMSDGHYYGCCACIGSAGIGLVPKMHALTAKDGLTLNLFIDGTLSASLPSGARIKIETKTDYPRGGDVLIALRMSKDEEFTLSIRNPAWSKHTSLSINDEKLDTGTGYTNIRRTWKDGDILKIELDMRTELMRPIPYGEQLIMCEVIWGANYVIPILDREDPMAKNHVALRRGPVMLALDKRLGHDPDEPVNIKSQNDGYVDLHITSGDAPYKCILEARVPTEDGEILLTDYASAGKLMSDESKMAVWLLTK